MEQIVVDVISDNRIKTYLEAHIHLNLFSLQKRKR